MAVVTCSNCGTKNRIDAGAVARRQPVCGRCETVLNVTADNKTFPALFRKGDIVGPYTLVQQIGRGGFGEVWLAEKTGLVTVRFALKLPKDDDIDTSIFKQEASIWVQASGHTNIVPIVEADVHSVKRDGVVLRPNQTVIVSEYLRDGSLQRRLERYEKDAMSTDVAFEIAAGILAGLKFLHTRQPSIIHRDLKPDNVLLQEETPRLTDFGIARMLKTNSYSQTAHISGTLPYMAPEVFKGYYSVRTDVWAAGVILYQLLSGRLPFPQTDIPALIGSIANDEPQPLPSSVPEPFRTVVYKALKKNPIERYQSAAEMRQALTDAKQGRSNWASTIPAPPPPPPRPSIFDLDNRKPVKPDPQERSVAKPSRRSSWIIAAVVVLISIFAFRFYVSRKPGTSASGTASDTSTPSANDINSAAAFPSVNTGPLVASGQVELETSEEPLFASQPNAQITQWLVKAGDFVNQSRVIAKYSYVVSPGSAALAGEASGRAATYSDGSLRIEKPTKIINISVSEGQRTAPGQEICRVATVLHVRVKAKLAPNDLARIPIGTNAFFKIKSKNIFKGRVEAVNIQEGIVIVKLLDEHVFDSKRFLTIDPDARGDVSFEMSAANK